MQNPRPLKLGDILLTLIFSALIACSLLTSTGCALLSKTSTLEQKLADVRALSYAAASIGTQEAILQNPHWGVQFDVAARHLDQLITTRTITGVLLRNILASLPVKELKSPQARIAIESATMLFDATVGDRINIEAQPYVLAAATGIRDGIKSGLGSGF